MASDLHDIAEEPSLVPEALRPFYQMWKRLPVHGGGRRYADFQIEAISANLIPWTVIVDVIKEPRDFRFRFWGTERAVLIGAEMSGKMLSEIQDEGMREGNRQEYEKVAARKRPFLCNTPVMTVVGRQVAITSIRLPFVDYAGNVTHILSAVDPNSVNEQHYAYFGTRPLRRL